MINEIPLDLSPYPVWAYWAPATIMRVPKYSLYHYMGYDASRGLYAFQHRKTKALLTKNHNQLIYGFERGDFRPFLINMEAVYKDQTIATPPPPPTGGIA